jgi:ankyrin repeat protein
MLSHGADPNIPTNSKFGAKTPLHAALERGHLDFVRLLWKNGADGGIQDANGKTPLAIARERGWDDIVKILEK